MLIPIKGDYALQLDYIEFNEIGSIFEFWLKKVQVNDETEPFPIMHTCWRFKFSIFWCTIVKISFWVD